MHKLLTGLGEYQIVVLTISYAYSKKSCDGLKKCVMEMSWFKFGQIEGVSKNLR